MRTPSSLILILAVLPLGGCPDWFAPRPLGPAPRGYDTADEAARRGLAEYVRLVDAQTPAEIFEKVAAHVKRHAPEVEFISYHGMLPSKTPLESPYATPIIQAVVDAQGEEPLVYPGIGGSLPDYVFTKILGIDAFVLPYANHDEANHAPNENLEISRFIKGIRTGAALLTRIGAVQPKS